MVFNFLLFSMYTERLWLLELRKLDSMAGVCVYKKKGQVSVLLKCVFKVLVIYSLEVTKWQL